MRKRVRAVVSYRLARDLWEGRTDAAIIACQIDTDRRRAGARDHLRLRPGPGQDPDRLRHLQDRAVHRGRQRHHASQLPAVGEGRERCRRDLGRRKETADRGDRVRRPLQLRGSRQGDRAPGDPGQGRLHSSALGHRPQPGRRPDLQPPGLSASGGHGGDRPRARDGKALAEQLLVPRRIEAGRGRAGRSAQQAEGREARSATRSPWCRSPTRSASSLRRPRGPP